MSTKTDSIYAALIAFKNKGEAKTFPDRSGESL